jgi:molybdate transport system substrate-binding protein
MDKRRIAAGSLLSVLLLGGTACTSDSQRQGQGSPTADSPEGTATVFAAASLTESFNELKAMFEEAHPAATITLNFGSSSGLAAQIIEQGGADIFASADQVNMQKVSGAGLVEGEPEIFARNKLEIIVAPDNPKRIRGLADLAQPDLKVVLGAAQVPVGRYGREALDKAGVKVRPVSEAVDVKGVVGPVTLGEADAGIVYASDVKAAGSKASGVEIPEEQNVIAEYPIALIKDSPNARAGRAFLELVRSDEGTQVLADHGFVEA